MGRGGGEGRVPSLMTAAVKREVSDSYFCSFLFDVTSMWFVEQHTTHESKTKYTLLYAKGHSAQPDMFWRTHHTKSDPKSMQVISLCLWGV